MRFGRIAPTQALSRLTAKGDDLDNRLVISPRSIEPDGAIRFVITLDSPWGITLADVSARPEEIDWTPCETCHHNPPHAYLLSHVQRHAPSLFASLIRQQCLPGVVTIPRLAQILPILLHQEHSWLHHGQPAPTRGFALPQALRVCWVDHAVHFDIHSLAAILPPTIFHLTARTAPDWVTIPGQYPLRVFASNDSLTIENLPKDGFEALYATVHTITSIELL